MENKFNEEDYKKFAEFLNFVAKKAKFEMNTNEVITYFGLLKHMQSSILPKIEKNILELIEVIESSEKEE